MPATTSADERCVTHLTHASPGQASEPELHAASIEALRAQIASLTEQLIESQRLAAIGTVSAVIAHEFNNLLTPVVNYAAMGLKTLDGPNPDLALVRKALTKATVGSEKAARICLSMLSLARGESTFGPAPVKHWVEEALAVLARDPQKDGIALRVQVPEDLAVLGDTVQLEQVLLNLLINARQAILAEGGGGSITVRAAVDETEPQNVRITVADTGPGIPEKILPRIFEPFFTTKGTAKRGETKGTGLGLAICKQIIEHHHGSIAASSVHHNANGTGTTFTIVLPKAA
jgi:signal transduction histidine kinase